MPKNKPPSQIMDRCDFINSITSLKESEEFLKKHCEGECLDEFLDRFLQTWKHKWKNFQDISVDVKEKIDNAHTEFLEKLSHEICADYLYVALECVVLNRLHDCIIPLISYDRRDQDKLFYEKCKRLSDKHVTAEQLGAPSDYGFPLFAAVVEFASLDIRKSPIEKVHCLCTTYDLIFAELKSGLIEIISRFDLENQIPVIENKDIIPILMAVIIKSKVIHLHTSMYYIENFLWKLNDSHHVRNTISVFKLAIKRITSLSDEDLKPCNDNICREMEFSKVSQFMCQAEKDRKVEKKSLVENHVHRIYNLILTSTTCNSI